MSRNVVLREVRSAFESLARLRSARAFHPDGATFTGMLTVPEGGTAVSSALAGTWPVVVRASKGIGTPGTWPDFRGLAVRVQHELGPVDLLFTTVERHLPYVLAPSTTWCSQPYTTFVPYLADDDRVILRLEPDAFDAAAGGGVADVERAVEVAPLNFTLQESDGLAWRSIGGLSIDRAVPQDVEFDPVLHQHPRLRHPRAIGKLRAWAYSGSRRGRDHEDATVTRLPT